MICYLVLLVQKCYKRTHGHTAPNSLLGVGLDSPSHFIFPHSVIAFLDKVVTDLLHLHNKRVHTFRGNYTEYLEAASDLETNKFRENTQMFVDKNKYKYDMIPRVVAAMKMLNNLPVLEKEPVSNFIWNYLHARSTIILIIARLSSALRRVIS